MISKLFFSVVGSSGIIGFLVYYSLKKSRIRKKLIWLFIILSLFLGSGKLAIKNTDSFIYNNKFVSTLNYKLASNTMLKSNFGDDVGLSFVYNLIVTPVIGSILIGVGLGGVRSIEHKSKNITYKLLTKNKKIKKRGDINGRKEEI